MASENSYEIDIYDNYSHYSDFGEYDQNKKFLMDPQPANAKKKGRLTRLFPMVLFLLHIGWKRWKRGWILQIDIYEYERREQFIFYVRDN